MQLTPREQQIICTLAAGRTNREIGSRLGLREQTVKNQLCVIYTKLGVRNRVELSTYAIEHRLIEPVQE